MSKDKLYVLERTTELGNLNLYSSYEKEEIEKLANTMKKLGYTFETKVFEEVD